MTLEYLQCCCFWGWSICVEWYIVT